MKSNFVVYHLINTATEYRYFGYVELRSMNYMLYGFGKNETDEVKQVIGWDNDPTKYFENEKALCEAIKYWGKEKFKFNLVDLYQNEEDAKRKVDELITRFEKRFEDDRFAYNGKDEVDEDEQRFKYELVVEYNSRVKNEKDYIYLAQRYIIDSKNNVLFSPSEMPDSYYDEEYNPNTLLKEDEKRVLNEMREEYLKELEKRVNMKKEEMKKKMSESKKGNKNSKVPLALINKLTGEEIYFESKGDCMKHLNISPQTFSKFTKGQCKKLNARYEVKKLVVKTI